MLIAVITIQQLNMVFVTTVRMEQQDIIVKNAVNFISEMRQYHSHTPKHVLVSNSYFIVNNKHKRFESQL